MYRLITSLVAKMGMLYARTLLHVVDEPTGEAGVKECKLLQ